VSVLTFCLFVPNVEEQCAPTESSALFAIPDSLAPVTLPVSGDG
jgi:hypothetical protein